MSWKSNTSKAVTKAKAVFLLFVFGVSTAVTGIPSAANAQVPSPVFDAAVAGQLGYQEIKGELDDVLVQAGVTALISSANYFASQIAYSAAVALTSDCLGQGPCWDSKAFEQGFTEAWQGAIGEAVGSLSEGILGNKQLCSPGALSLVIQLGHLNELRPPAPKCSFATISSSWSAIVSSVESGDILKQLIPIFQPGQAPIAVGVDVLDGMFSIKADARLKYVVTQIKQSGGGGFAPVTDPISGRVKAPAVATEEEFKTSQDNKGKNQKASTETANAGAIAKGAIATVGLNAATTFTQTLVARLWNRLVDGLLSTEELISAQPGLVLDFEAVLNPGASGIAQALQSRFITATPRDIGLFDPLLDFITCPGAGASPNNCVMDGQFANLVRVGDAVPLTVAEAIQKGMLHKDWPLIPSSLREKDRDNFCYTYGYCESNLKKLRASRIIPIGWEIAASKSPANAPVTLGEVVSRFNDCNIDGEMDGAHPWCHLIDPNWVLKAPPTQCRAQVFGPSLLTPEAPSRSDTCADAPTCLRQDDYGACTGGWGYCTRERNVWRFQGDQCPSYYNSCRTLSTRLGGPVSYLINTITYGVCNADNVGCTQYVLEANLNQSESLKADDWSLAGGRRFLNKNAATCQVNDAGCSAVVPLTPVQSLNLVRNGGFEQMEDGDGDGTPDHAKHWMPFAVSPASGADVSSGFVNQRGEVSSSGQSAISVGRNLSATKDQWSANCVGFAGIATCNSDAGCTCTYNGSRDYLDGYSCKIPRGKQRCLVTSRVMQTDIPVRTDATYTAAVTFTSVDDQPDAQGFFWIQFYDQLGSPVRVSASNVTTLPVSVSGGTATFLPDQACTHVVPAGADPSFLAVAFSGTKAADSVGIRASCTFQIKDPNVAKISIELGGLGDNDGLTAPLVTPYADDVQIEEGSGTAFHEEYGSALPTSYIKLAPDYLGCTGEESDRPECASYSGVCRENELGCESYKPSNGDPSIPAVTGPQDACPAECSGYDVFKQEATLFDGERFPVYFIPSSAKQCSEAESGCSEFTNVQTEQVAYFSELRLCERPSDVPETVFYSWEGSDTTGYQLRVWNLKKTTAAVPNRLTPAGSVAGIGSDQAAMSDLGTSVVADGNAGFAPCTDLDDNATNCVSRDSGSGTSDSGLCSRADVEAGDFDCREFYDAAGNRHYRLLSKTIVLTASCADHRITVSTQDDCENTNGRWVTSAETGAEVGQCVYATDVTQSRVCSVAANGCRPYKGNAAGNVRNILNEDFEDSTTTWTGGTLSSEAIVVGGHSRRLSGTDATRTSVAGTVASGRSYSVSFWARGSGTLEASFVGSREVRFTPQVVLASEWRQYSLGPISVNDPAWGPTDVSLQIAFAGGTEAYIDNIILKEVQDNIFVVRDSWRTPVSCDRTTDGLPSPQEMLGCKQYAPSKGGTAFLRSFSTLCREKAVGCSAYSDTRNSVADPYAHTWNAICALPAACVGGNCPCDFDTRPIVQTESSGTFEPVVLGDVCRVPVGQTSCRFELDRLIDPWYPLFYPDVASVSADRKLFLVPKSSDSCSATAIGCKAAGVQKQAYERTCTLSTACDAASCNCVGEGVTCSVERGESACTVNYDSPQTVGWTSTVIKDDPTVYLSTLCRAEAVSCEEFKAADGTYYFKSPGDQTCSFKEGVSVDGQARFGWFRKSASGADEPCYPSLLQNGEYFAIAKNADPTYRGWVGICTPEYDRCEEFVDRAATSPSNPEGEPYYYLMNNKLDLRSCAGEASLKEGCVLFDRTGNTAKTSATYATYYESDREANGSKVPPIDCDANSRDPLCERRCTGIENGRCAVGGAACQTNGDCASGACVGDVYFGAGCRENVDCSAAKGETCSATYGNTRPATNDSNVVLKVRRDRECAEWLQCSATESSWDAATGKWKNICVGIDVCQEQRKVGESQECGRWAPEANPAVLTDRLYAERDVSYRGLEYSGYSLPGKFQVQLMSLAQSGEGPSDRRYGVVTDPDFRCTVTPNVPIPVGPITVFMDIDNCPDGGKCYGGRCYQNLSGGPLTENLDNIGQCRGYPESDSPFNGTAAAGFDTCDADGTCSHQANSLKSGFVAAQVCSEGNDCDCHYTRYGYGQSGVTTRFYGRTLTDPAFEAPIGICSGGPNEGDSCEPAGSDTCVIAEGGRCVRQTRVTNVVGWEGLCVDPDYSFNVAGDPDRYACNLWFPVDQLAGAQDLNNQQREAGYNPGENVLYCSAALGHVGSSYEHVIMDEIGLVRSAIGDGIARWMSGMRGWFTTMSSNGTGNERYIQTFDTGAVNPQMRLVSGIHITVNAGQGGQTLGDGSVLDFYLTRQNGWQFAVPFSADENPPGGTKFGYDDGVYCLDHFESDNEDTISGDSSNSICIRANWADDTSLDSFTTVTVNNRDSESFGARYYVTATYLQREACMEVVQVSRTSSSTLPSVAWTDRLLGSGLTGAGYDQDHISTRFEEEVSQEPYGRIKQAINSLTSSRVRFSAEDDIDSDWPLTVAAGEGGSPYMTTYLKEDEDGNGIWAHDRGVTASGVPFSCLFGCGSVSFPIPTAWQNRITDSRTVATANLSQLFAVGWRFYSWDSGNEYDSSSSNPGWDLRTTQATPANEPVVRAVVTSSCAGAIGCPEGGSGVSVNGFASGNQTGTGRFRAIISFYAEADKDHMPIRKKYVDFGDGSSPNISEGFYKNRRGCETDNTGRCIASLCDGSVWGTTAESCENSYFSVNKVYTCSEALLAQTAAMPACSPGGGRYPCQRSGACVYKPRVRIVDNWGQCNGSCPTGPFNVGAGDVCINSQRSFSSGGECDVAYDPTSPTTWRSWTEYPGEIIVRP